MEMTTQWIWIGVISCGFLAAGLSLLWVLAGRALREDAGLERRRRPRRSIMRVLEHRLERLLVSPPQWGQIARRAQPYLLGALGLALGASLVWTLWSYAGSWLSDPPMVQHSTPPRTTYVHTPFEATVDRVSHLLIPKALSAILCIAAAAFAAFGDVRNAVICFGLVLMFGAMQLPSFIASLHAEREPVRSQPLDSDRGSPVGVEGSAQETQRAVGTPPPQDSSQRNAKAPTDDAVASGASHDPNGAEVMTNEPMQTPPISTQRASGSEDAHFGVGDALMMYGAYKLLTHEGSSHEPQRSPESQRSLSPLPAAGSDHPTIPRKMNAAPQSPAYRPVTGRVSAIRTSPVRSAPVFRSSPRRSR